MGKLPIFSGREVCRILENHGFSEVRRRGSHIVMQRILPNLRLRFQYLIIKKFASACYFLSFGNQVCRGQNLNYKKSSNQSLHLTKTAGGFGR